MEIDSYLSEKQKKRKKRRAYLYVALAFVIAYAVFAGMLWLVLRSPLFRLDKMVVRGNTAVLTGDMVTLLQASALRDHNFWKALLGFRNMLIWPDSLSPADLIFLPQVAAVTVARDYLSHTITATVTERQPFAIWCLMPRTDMRGSPALDQVCYWFDDHGLIFEKTYDTEGSLLFAIHDYSQGGLGLNGKILPTPFVANLLSVVNVIRESGIHVKEAALRDLGLQQIDITTYDGPALYFSLRFPADRDRAVLQSLIVKPGFSKLQYVDFRVENRAYYK